MKEKYLSKLYKQFCDAYGIKYDILDVTHPEFNNWLFNYKTCLEEYGKLLVDLGVPFDNTDINNLFRIEPKGKSVVELDKGNLDSLVVLSHKKDDEESRNNKYDNLGNVTVVSSFASTLGLENSNIIMVNKNPKVLFEKEAKEIEIVPTFISHNAYDESTIDKLGKIYDAGYRILYGVFGSLDDKDKEKKMQDIFKLQEILLLDGEVEYIEKDDKYISAIKTTCAPKVRKK